MAIPEDIVDLWSEFPSQPKIEPLDDLFDNQLAPMFTKKSFETPTSLSDNNVSESGDVVTDSFEGRPGEPKESTLEVEVIGSDSTMVGGIFKAPKLYAYDDFRSFLAREGGIGQDQLSTIVGDVSPRPDEDFVAFLARSNGIKDEQIISRLRQTLKLDPVIEFNPAKSGPVKMEVDLDLQVREGEDAASFLARARSWESASSISDELASVGLDEFADEDAESFFRRTESASDNERDGEHMNGSQYGPGITIISPQVEKDVPEKETLVQLSGPAESIGLVPKERVLVKKRKLSLV